VGVLIGVALGLVGWLGLGVGQVAAEGGVGDCGEIEITEVLTNFRNDQSEQFVEFFNPTAGMLSLEGCVVRTRYGGKDLTAEFGEVWMRSGEYQAYSLESLGLQIAKSPTIERVIEIVGGDFVALAELPRASIGKSFALVEGAWVNATPTPSADNLTAPEFLGGEDGGAVGSEEGSGVAGAAGGGLAPEVMAPVVHDSLGAAGGAGAAEYADCGEGRYRNPETNRCKKIETEPELKPCAEGYERNPETNRCRKIRENVGAAASFGVPDSGGASGGTGVSAVGEAMANVSATMGDAFDRVFRDADGYLQGWKVVLAVVLVVLAAGIGVCYVFRERLMGVPFFAEVMGRTRDLVKCLRFWEKR